jgi:ABC-type Zn uptake system ZnuABC Zn-binding protein ZnuA
MSDVELAKAHQEAATKNAREAIRKADATHAEMSARMTHLDHLVAQLSATVGELQQKYNLLLTARFDGKATSR